MKLLLPILVLIVSSYLLSKIPHEKPKATVKEVVKVQPRPVPEVPESKPLTPPIVSDTRSDLVGLICRYFGSECRLAVAIAQAESGLRCDAISPTNDHGVFQINMKWHANKFVKSPYDCEENIRVAYQIRMASTWKAWSAFKNGSYLKFL